VVHGGEEVPIASREVAQLLLINCKQERIVAVPNDSYEVSRSHGDADVRTK
jgi:hypothetical protein